MHDDTEEITYEEKQLEHEVAALRQGLQHLTQKAERVNKERCQEQSELIRLRSGMTQISGLATDALPAVHSLAYRAAEQDDLLDSLTAIIRSIHRIAS